MYWQHISCFGGVKTRVKSRCVTCSGHYPLPPYRELELSQLVGRGHRAGGKGGELTGGRGQRGRGEGKGALLFWELLPPQWSSRE